MATLNKGFTLIEMVVVAGLIGVLSVGIVSIFISTIQGNYKAKLQAEIKEQGDFAISSMERTIRNSKTQPKCLASNTLVTFSGDVLQYRFINIPLSNTIEKSEDGGTSWTPILSLGTAITAGSFTCVPDTTTFTQGKVVIKFNAKAKNSGGSLDQEFGTTVAIRTIK